MLAQVLKIWLIKTTHIQKESE